MLRTHEKYNQQNLEDMETITKKNYIEYICIKCCQWTIKQATDLILKF